MCVCACVCQSDNSDGENNVCVWWCVCVRLLWWSGGRLVIKWAEVIVFTGLVCLFSQSKSSESMQVLEGLRGIARLLVPAAEASQDVRPSEMTNHIGWHTYYFLYAIQLYQPGCILV